MLQVVEDSFIPFMQTKNPTLKQLTAGSYILPEIKEINMPPNLLKRNSAGLFENVTYHYKDTGRIDWRAMVRPEFLVPNRSNFAKKGLPVPETIDGLEDKDLLILLAGAKDLLVLRGYNFVDPVVMKADENEVLVKTTIEFIPNYETNGRVIRYGALAAANRNNTNGFGQNFLAAVAENRGLVRAVRGFLEINVVGNDEIPPTTATASYEEQPKAGSGINPLDKLKQFVTSNNIKFSNFKKLMVKNNVPNAVGWGSLDSVPTGEVFVCLGHLKKALEKK